MVKKSINPTPSIKSYFRPKTSKQEKVRIIHPRVVVSTQFSAVGHTSPVGSTTVRTDDRNDSTISTPIESSTKRRNPTKVAEGHIELVNAHNQVCEDLKKRHKLKNDQLQKQIEVYEYRINMLNANV